MVVWTITQFSKPHHRNHTITLLLAYSQQMEGPDQGTENHEKNTITVGGCGSYYQRKRMQLLPKTV